MIRRINSKFSEGKVSSVMTEENFVLIIEGGDENHNEEYFYA
jgi:hypothetical protein